MRKLGITAKFLIHAAWILIGLGLAVTAYSVSQLRQLLYHEMVRRVEAQTLNWIEANTSQIILSGSSEILQRQVGELKKREGIAYVILLDVNGQRTAAINVPTGLNAEGPTKEEPGAGPRWVNVKDSQGLRYFELITRISAAGPAMSPDLETMFGLAAKGPTWGEVRVGVDRQEYEHRLGALVRKSVVLASLLVVLAVLASLVFAKRMVTPIISMGRAATQIAAGKLSERVESGSRLRDELGDLVRNFNQMAQRLQENQEEMRLLYSGLEEKVRERTLELEQANRRLKELDELKSKFLSTVSHELRTPLTSVKAFSEILLDSPYPNPERQRRFLGIINEESDRLARLISDLLDLTKIESGTVNWRMSCTDLQEIVRESKDLLVPHVTQKGIHLKVVESQPLPVWADADRIRQVITNLVSNAIKFCSEGATVEVQLDRSTMSGPHNAGRGEYARVMVADTGPGISPEDRERVFEPFYQGSSNRSADSGTGLGLAICKEIVLHHNGEIWVESELGIGSRFYFTVPLHITSAALEVPSKHEARRN